jgi:DNA-binding beta-propeller fold protein YncE
MLLRPVSRATHICIALAFPLLVAACGGGGGGSATIPPPPPDVIVPVTAGLTNFQEASFALGQANLESGSPNRDGQASPSGLDTPEGLALTPDGSLLVADVLNNRVLLFAPPTAMGQAAVEVLGQPDLFSDGSGLSQEGLNNPRGVALGVGKMVVADPASRRILIYDGIPRQGAIALPTGVVGQRRFDTSLSDCDLTHFLEPRSVAITPAGKLIVVDSNNNRVLVWNQVPAGTPDSEPVPPDAILGQRQPDQCQRNDEDGDGAEDTDDDGNPIATARTLSRPVGLWADDRRLIVSDSGNHRVLIWNYSDENPLTDFKEADVVLGHDNFNTTGVNGDAPPATAHTLSGPTAVHSDGTSLVVADTGNARVLIWNTLPQTSFQRADVVIGQAGFEEVPVSDTPPAPTAKNLVNPRGVLLAPDALFVSDAAHHRVLVYRRNR